MEETTVITPEVMPQEAVTIIEASGVEQSTAAQIRTAFLDMFANAEKWTEQAKAIKVTDVSQVREMKMAREARLALREIRCNAENSRKRLKADALAKGKAIDGICNVLKALIEPVESYLLDQEEFKKRIEAEEKRKLAEARQLALEPFAEFYTHSPAFDLSSLPQEQFDAMLEGLKIKRDAKIAAERKLEEERIKEEERLRQEAVERERKRQEELEEAKKKAEEERKAREDAERKAAEERTAMQAKLDAERKERERVEAEQRAKAEAERKAKEEEEKRAAQAAKAPDKQKLSAFASEVRGLTDRIPQCSTKNGKVACVQLSEQVAKFAAWVDSVAEKL